MEFLRIAKLAARRTKTRSCRLYGSISTNQAPAKSGPPDLPLGDMCAAGTQSPFICSTRRFAAQSCPAQTAGVRAGRRANEPLQGGRWCAHRHCSGIVVLTWLVGLASLRRASAQSLECLRLPAPKFH